LREVFQALQVVKPVPSNSTTWIACDADDGGPDKPPVKAVLPSRLAGEPFLLLAVVASRLHSMRRVQLRAAFYYPAKAGMNPQSSSVARYG